MVLIAVLVGATLLQPSASNVATITKTVDYTNITYAAPAGVGGNITLSGQANRNVIVTNATSGTTVPASNYTVTNYVLSNGQLVSKLQLIDNTIGVAGKNINISSTVEPYGYDTNSGNRAITDLIIVFFALGIAITVATIIFKSGLLDL